MDKIAALCRSHLEAVVAMESSSDERSEAIPSTIGQHLLAGYLEEFFSGLGATVTRDAHANVIATLNGRGACADRAPLALMIHLDTARGTKPLPRLDLLEKWDGQAIPYPKNDRLQVSIKNYPGAAMFLGHDLVHGDGVAPFGLDDKLGLAQVMTLARILRDEPSIPHRPLFLICRPDEELGRIKTMEGLAQWLAENRVGPCYTVDGIAPFEVNYENFNGMGASIRFPSRPYESGHEQNLEIEIRGVNTHGATAKAEGHRSAVRLAAEVMGALEGSGVRALSFESDPLRDCDGLLRVTAASIEERAAIERALATVIDPHEPRGAGWSIRETKDSRGDLATGEMLSFMLDFMASRADVPLLAEDSEGFEGYTHPYRARTINGHIQLDVRLRDFDKVKLEARRAHLASIAAGRPMEAVHQYDNLGPRSAGGPELLKLARSAAQALGLEAQTLPIRGGTGVDAFLERGVSVANLGTGYFAPESEKEFTSLQFMAQHTAWLVALVQQ
jgi:tripeptide aminopeptidase